MSEPNSWLDQTLYDIDQSKTVFYADEAMGFRYFIANNAIISLV